MKATEQYLFVVLYIMIYQMVLNFKSVDQILTLQMKATEQYFPVLFIMLHKVVLTLSLLMKS